MPLQTQKHRLSALGVLAVLAGGFYGQLPQVLASSWSPTLLVNTEAFQVIDDTNSSADLYIQFGDSLNKRLTYDRTVGTFIFDDDLEVIGTASGRQIHAQDLLTSSGQTIIEGNQAYDPALLVVDQNSTSGSGQLIDSESTNQAGLIVDMPAISYTDANDLALNPHILFGYNNLFDTNLYRQTGSTLKTDDSLWVKQTVSGATIRSFGLTDCDNATDSKLLWDETTGTFSCGTDQGGGGSSAFTGTGALQAFFDNRYVETGGDTMTGALVISPTTDSTSMLRVNDADGGNPVFNVDSTNERVGIGTATPAVELDVVGSFRRASSNGPETEYYQEVRTVGTTAGDTTEIGTFNFTNGAGLIEVDYTVQTSGISNAAKYIIPTQYANQEQGGNNTWFKVQPISYTGTYGSNEIELDVRVNNTEVSLRLRRVSGANGGFSVVNMKAAGNTVTYTSSSTTASGVSAPTDFFGASALTQRTGSVGIGTTNPDTKLEVVGTLSGVTLHAQDLLTSSGAFIAEGNLTFGDAVTDTITVNARFASSLIPDTDDTYDLGSSSLRWRDVYVGPASLHIGTDGNEAQIGYDTTGNEIEFDANDDGTPEVVFEDGGNVGIGTEAPKAALDVQGTISGTTLDVNGNANVSGTLSTDTIAEYTTDSGVTVDGFAIQDGYADASAIKMATTDSGVTRTVQDSHNYLNPAGRITGGGITDNGNGTVTVAAGSGFIRTSNADTAALQFVQWAQSGSIAIASGNTRYFGVGYRSGSPAVIMKTSNTWNYNTEFPLNTATNDGGTMEVSNNLQAITAAGGVLKRFYETRPLERDERTGGLILSETGTRNIAMTAGAMWARLSRVSISAIDTSGSDTFDRYYSDGASGWTKQTGQTQWDNTQYDDSSGTLATMTNNRYSVQWFYIETDGDLVSLYGDAQYTTASSAEAAEPPQSVPDRLTEGGKLIGRIIFQKDASSASAVQNVFGTEFPTTLANDHGNLSGLTDDDHTQYALLAGRSGGQTLIGGTDAGDNLTFNSTSNGTKGKLFFGSSAAFDEVNTRLGIGTTSPETALEVVGTASGRHLHAQDLLTSSGNLIVANTVEGTGSGTMILKNYTATDGTDGTSILFKHYRGSTERETADIRAFGLANNGGGELAFRVRNEGGAGSWIDAMYIDTAGNVGIGDTTPDENLDIESTDPDIQLRTTFANPGTLSSINWQQFNETSAAAIHAWVDTNTSNYLRLDVAGSEVMRLEEGGDVGIGTTSPETALEVVGTASGTKLHAQDLLTSSGNLIIDPSSAATAITVNGNSSTFTLDASTFDEPKLTSDESLGLVADHNVWVRANQGGMVIDKPTSNLYTSLNILRFDSDRTDRNAIQVVNESNDPLFTVDGTGDVGIGTTNADAELDVIGTVSGSVIRSFGLSDCDNTTTSKLLWDATTGQFSCGTDQSGGSGDGFTGTGSLQAFFDNRYVEVGGDTMTGALVFNPSIDSTSLFRVNDADGGNPVFNVDSTNERVSVGTATADASFEVESSAANWSGALLVDMNTASAGTGAMIYSDSDDSPGLAISMTDHNAVDNPHILFGYGNIFDTKLYRNSGASLRTNGDLIVDGNIGVGTNEVLINGAGKGIQIHGTSSGDISGLRLTNASTGSGSLDGAIIGVFGTVLQDNLLIWQYENKAMRFATNNTQRMIIQADGDVGIGEETPAYRLEIGGGDVNTTGGGYRDAGSCVAGTCASDRNLKENIEPITGAFQKLKNINPSTFTFKDEHFGPGKQYGLIAQEVEQVLPDLVEESPDGYKTVKYGMQLQMLTMAATKEVGMLAEQNLEFGNKLSARLDDFASQLEQVQADIAEIQERLPNIEGNGTVLQIAEGTIEVNGTYHIVAPEDDEKDTLANITGGTLNQTLVLQAVPGNKITVRKTGKLLLSKGDYVLDKPGDVLVLLKATDDMWVELSRTGGNVDSLSNAIQQYRGVFELTD